MFPFILANFIYLSTNCPQLMIFTINEAKYEGIPIAMFFAVPFAEIQDHLKLFWKRIAID